MISAFKHIRLSGLNLTPTHGQGDNTRLGMNGSGFAYYSELANVSGVLQSAINTANADVNSLFIHTGNGLGYTLQDNITLSGADGTTVEVNGQTIIFSGNNAAVQSSLSTLTTNLVNTGANLRTYVDATFVSKTTQQVFSTALTPGSDAYTILFNPVFGSAPKVQATLEVPGDVMYNLSVKNIGTAGYTGALSDDLTEANTYIHTFASLTQ